MWIPLSRSKSTQVSPLVAVREIGSRGACRRARNARHNLVFGWVHGNPDHEAAIRFSGKAPKWQVHSGLGIEAMAVFGSPPPRTMINGQLREAMDAETVNYTPGMRVMPFRPPLSEAGRQQEPLR
jgi:hypothetical protein